VSGKALLDTSVVIPFLKQERATIEKLIDKDEVYVPFTVVGELYYGAYKSSRVPENVEEIDKFASDSVILPFTNDVAKEYGKIKSELMFKGKPIPENDVWIAAVARCHKLALVTRDVHFADVDNLVVENW
jgi:tRNA(fMet)-specific endonuclease VapC